MGPYLYFRVLIFTFLASFTQRMSIQSACIQQWFRFKLLANFDFYLCLRINFHTSSFWVLILAAGGPYWVLISQKNGSLLGPYLKAWGSLLVLETVVMLNWRTMKEVDALLAGCVLFEFFFGGKADDQLSIVLCSQHY